MRLTVAGNALTTERAANIIGSYAHNHVKTLGNYDGRAYERARHGTYDAKSRACVPTPRHH